VAARKGRQEFLEGKMATKAVSVFADQQVTLADVQAAHKVVAPHIVRTHTLRSQTLSNITGADIWLKFENLQFTAAYKERGALNRLSHLSAEERRRGVIAMSAGNHAQGVAYHGHRLGIPVTIIMPKGTPTVKVMQTESHGATVILHGEKLEESANFAREMALSRNLTFVHPFDDPLVIAGQGTVVLEMLEDVPELDCLAVPIGGGGLISGMAVAARALKPDIGIIGVQAEQYPSMAAKVKGFEAICDGDTIAEGIAVKYPGEITSRIVKELVDDILLVSEVDLERAIALLLTIEKTVTEGAGAAGLAAVLARPERFRGKKVGIVLCGGNIDTRLLANVLLRNLAREGRLARLRVRLKDRAGELYHLAAVFHELGVNIIDVSHQRVFTKLPAKGTYADIEAETRDNKHLDQLLDTLRERHYDVRLIDAV
jgi:threonine dehydratase